ncbi:ArsR/SmtB family transcription factor [Carboxylicivirga linearis]|uniref:Winged helix-turn-helix transcriptional regulator n=1 Tax=Carboxylicivirga linearis TaxID=1628157 RepID=A0ABS5JTR7_9BACT|nr:metalloregulator ArsR/SmtB family transcription factor [Carboxylicivirga linearis]MBS2098248.1 winged helix-turn-helix transcriptional regulator [Carboxylicivirga linearis]
MAEAKNQLFDSDLQELAQLFKALGHPARLQILKFLASKNACFTGDISDEVPLGRTTVNQHLAELRKAGLIQGTVQGVKTNYCINPSVVKHLEEMGKDFFDGLSIIECTDC